jgi:outer membrane protein
MRVVIRCLAMLWLTLASVPFIASAQPQDGSKIIGDVGAANYTTPAITRSNQKNNVLLPYVYADYENWYARVDTFGYKIATMGVGHLEIATRISFEDFQPVNAGIDRRARPKPLGVGTFQETPYGAFFFYAFRDTTSGGMLLDATYAAEFVFADWHFYPQFGVEQRDQKYVGKLYGVDSIEAQRSGLTAYSPKSSTSPNIAMAAEYPFADHLKLTVQLRKRYLDKAIQDSPLVNAKQQTSGFVAVTKTFE